MKQENLTMPEPVKPVSVQMQTPPELEPGDGISTLLTSLLPMLGSVGSIVMTSLTNTGITGYITSGMFLLTSLGFVGVNGWRQRSQKKAKMLDNRKAYLNYLSKLRETVRDVAYRQRRFALWNNPEPSSLSVIAKEGSRVWERTTESDMFLGLRLGTASQKLQFKIEPPEIADVSKLDPVPASMAHKFLLTHSTVDNIPYPITLETSPILEVIGDNAELCRGLVRSVLTELATFASPDNLKICLLVDSESSLSWNYLTNLPHLKNKNGENNIITDISDLEEVLQNTERDSDTALIVISDGERTEKISNALSQLGVSEVKIISIPEKWDELNSNHIVRVDILNSNEAEVLRVGYKTVKIKPDQLSVVGSGVVVELLNRLATVGDESEGTVSSKTKNDILALMGLDSIYNLNFEELWRLKLGEERLNVPIGMTPEGDVVNLDIKEAAQGGMGPNGAMVGTVGSGKSEVIKTIILALMMKHSSEQLNFVLIDFKGGSTYFGLENAPHVSAIITNLEGASNLVDRLQEALEGEVSRRQEVLAEAQKHVETSVSDVLKYEKERREGHHDDWEILPALFIIADEFSALLDAKPEFANTFQYLGKVGRSLDIHILIASQRFEESRLKGLETNLAYRIGLRTETPSDSQAIIGKQDSAFLPREAGWGIIHPDQVHWEKFRATYVSGTVKGDKQKRNLFDIAIQQMTGKSIPAHKVWLDPLEIPSAIDELYSAYGDRLAKITKNSKKLEVILGLVDMPREQRRDPLLFDLKGQNGNIAIVGGPMSGKSVACRTLITSLAYNYSPEQVSFYYLDFGGGDAVGLKALEHMATVATKTEKEKVERTIAELMQILEEREQQNIETGKKDFSDLFLIIDGWANFKTDYEDFQDKIAELASNGLTFGIHIVITAGRWMDIRANVKDYLGSRLELRLGEPSDSEVDRKEARNVPTIAGRGLTDTNFGKVISKDENGRPVGKHMMFAFPKLQNDKQDIVEFLNQKYPGKKGQKLQMLPELLEYDKFVKKNVISRKETKENKANEFGFGNEVSKKENIINDFGFGNEEIKKNDSKTKKLSKQIKSIKLGIEESRMSDFEFDPLKTTCAYLYGDDGFGKTSFLRLIINEIKRNYTSEEAKILTIDPQRSLLGEIPDEYNLGYFNSVEDMNFGGQPLTFDDIANTIFDVRKKRAISVTKRKDLKERTWMKGKFELFILVDDYDLLATGYDSPLKPLVPYIARASDVGMHIILTRRTGGASRASSDPVISKMHDLGQLGILLSGSPDEGALIDKVKPEPLIPGRAKIVTREGVQKIQLAYAKPAEE
ncbi:MAG: type VII secretion protein EccCa [Candidatus Ancillula sp.]|jgi:S-DNA-T family DNA segregation ATPase FtsK/SpoIIIE|nr:type VII secretion protein EccCa [Candidatus Ancillula sp.]